MLQRHPLNRFPTTQEIAGNVGCHYAVDAFGSKVFYRALLEQNPGIVHQRSQWFTFSVDRLKHCHDLAFIADIRPQGKCFAAC
ncbi:hypothetical protein D3C81_1749860 [compost metagenome]